MAACSREPFAVGSMEDYEETGDLGKGSYGSVVKARHRATGQEVAIKRLGAPDQGQAGVLREKRFLEACRGIPNVVGFNGLVQQPGTTELGLVMECVSPSLRNFFQQRREDVSSRLPESTVRSIMWQLLSGAKKMHERHIMHRDLKPENILVNIDQDIVVKICDFGLALHMSDAPPYGTVGSKWYMAPEVLLGKTDYDALVDTWSLGCVMAELIDGCLLFHGTNREDQLCAIINVLGIPDNRKWPWFYSTPLVTRLKSKLLYAPRRNALRERFPETMLSEQGFKILNGLLTWNPDKRLTARAALKLPWFANHRTPEPAREEDFTPAVPKMEDM